MCEFRPCPIVRFKARVMHLTEVVYTVWRCNAADSVAVCSGCCCCCCCCRCCLSSVSFDCWYNAFLASRRYSNVSRPSLGTCGWVMIACRPRRGEKGGEYGGDLAECRDRDATSSSSSSDDLPFLAFCFICIWEYTAGNKVQVNSFSLWRPRERSLDHPSAHINPLGAENPFVSSNVIYSTI